MDKMKNEDIKTQSRQMKEEDEEGEKPHEEFNVLQSKVDKLITERDQLQRSVAYYQNQYRELVDIHRNNLESLKNKERGDFLEVFFSFRIMLINCLKAIKDQKGTVDSEKLLDSVIKGMDMVDKYLMNSLKNNYSLEEIACNLGDAFDYSVHEAKQFINTTDESLNNKISAILSAGYKIKEMILKPVQVEVYKFEK